MVYRDLLNELLQLTPQQLDEEVIICHEDGSFKEIEILVLNEDYYYNKDYPEDGCCPESEIGEDDRDNYEFSLSKGTVTIQLYN